MALSTQGSFLSRSTCIFVFGQLYLDWSLIHVDETMNIVEETLDSIVHKQSYIEDTYNTVAELLEHCKSLKKSIDAFSGTIYMKDITKTHGICLLIDSSLYET